MAKFEKAILATGGILIAFYVVSKALFVVKPFALAFLIGLAFHPVLSWLEGKGIRRSVSLTVGILILLVLVGICGYFVLPVFAAQMAGLLSELPRLWAEVARGWNVLHQWFPKVVPPLDQGEVSRRMVENVGKLFPLARQFATALFGLLANSVLVFFIMVFGLTNPARLKDFLLGAFPPRHRERSAQIGRRILGQLKSWIQGLLLAMLVVGLLSYMGLLVLGVQYAFFFGVLSGFLEIVPYIGPILSAVIPAALTALDDPTKAVYVLGLFFLVQQLENHILIPFIMSRQLTLHPLGVIFFFLVMTYWLGFFGTFVAVPTYACVAILYEEIYLQCINREEAVG